MKNQIRFSKVAALAMLAISAVSFCASKLAAQTYSYPEYDMEGDTIWHTFPPPDTTYVHNELILKFLDGQLNKDSLCYDCEDIVGMRTKGKSEHPLDDETTVWFADCKQTLMTQHFTLNIIEDPVVRAILEAEGVTYLRRMTAANPCVDTLSLSRFGDTIRMDHYNWMIADFNNDTSVIPTLTALLLTYDGNLQIAEPNYYMIPESTPRFPIDSQYAAGKQISLGMIGMPTAWGFDVGEDTVAVVDAGVDYWRCDLGGSMIPNGKVVGGWDYLHNDLDSVYFNSVHGTQVASIIGALTNNESCGPTGGGPNGMAGIGGGFNGVDGTPNIGKGVKLLAYNVVDPENPGGAGWLASSVASAILESSSYSINGNYGFGCGVINVSGGYNGNNKTNYSLAVRNAISDAWLNATNFVCGNADGDSNIVPNYPAYTEPPSELIVVSGTGFNKSRQGDVNWGYHTDLLAPGGEEGGADTISLALQLDTADGPDSASHDPDRFAYFAVNSAATPHVSGVTALLRGWLTTNGIAFAREDIEGMLESSALDLGNPNTDHFFPAPRTDPDGTRYIAGFDDHAGWGFLQADQLFNMIDPEGEYQYRLAHVEIPYDSLNIPPWPDTMSYYNVDLYNATPDTSNIPSHWTYDVKIREITGTYSYAGLGFNQSDSLYVWGNSGFGLIDTVHRGYANLLPNWGEFWCGVTSGLLGNQGVLIPKGDTTYHNIGAPGIHHGYSTEVTCHTYQYQTFKHGDTSVYGYWPSSSKLGLGYTVFGATQLTAGVKNSSSTGQFSVWPSIASTSFNVSLENFETSSNFTLFDELGREVFNETSMPGTNQFDVPVTNLASGIYFARLVSQSGTDGAKVVVQH